MTSVHVTFLPASARGFPQFNDTQRSFRLTESAARSRVHTFHAFTPRGSDLSYRVAGGDGDGAFSVAASGELSGRVDFERRRHYYLVLEARDAESGLTAYMRLSVEVVDANDNAPEFDEPYYSATLREGDTPPQAVVTVTARDADSGANGRVTYRLADEHDAFAIDARQGALTAVVALDREATPSYTLNVIATDQVRF